MEKLNFESPEEMYNVVKNGFDIYNIQTEEYVYVMNDKNDFFIGHIDNETANEAATAAKELDECWGYDILKGETTNGFEDTINYCQENYNKGKWVLANETFLEKTNINDDEHILLLQTPDGWIKNFTITFSKVDEKGWCYRDIDVSYSNNIQDAMQLKTTQLLKLMDSITRKEYKIKLTTLTSELIQKFKITNSRARKPNQGLRQQSATEKKGRNYERN